jgi:hypothetical protein
MKKMISKQSTLPVLAVSLTCLCLVAFCKEQNIPTLSNHENKTYENYARSLFPVLWTNDCSGLYASVRREEILRGHPWSEKIVVDLHNKERKTFCIIYFQPGTSNVLSTTNFEYEFGRNRDKKQPMHTLEQARTRMQEIAKLCGVTNLLNPTCYRTTDVLFTGGTWEHTSDPVINGYRAFDFSVSIRIMDSVDMPLCSWYNSISRIPNNLPTNVVLTAGEARAKGEYYLKKYYPNKERLPMITFSTNRLEYIQPNSRYIDPKKDAANEDTRGPKDTRLAWVNYFIKSYERLLESSLPIYVDAETGEMLGGQ